MRLHSLEANVDPANAASIKLLEKKGFLKEAHLKENVFFNGRFIDSAIYSLINPGD
jgi:ribosomal-protein-alanine N-acetyltransferase